MEKEEIIEFESLKDLGKIVRESKKWQLNLVVIGGYAVRAYTKGYRYTKDIDMVAPKKDMGRLIALLKELGYKVDETKFGLKGKKKLDGGFISLDISVGEVWDVSTDKRYPVDEILEGAKTGEISGFFEESRKIRINAFIASLEDLFVLKLMTRGREKDIVDITSLLIDKGSEVYLDNFSSKCSKAELNKHLKNQILNLVGLIKTDEVKKIWLKITGQRLARKTEGVLIKYLKELEGVLI